MNFKYFPIVSGKKVSVPLPFADGYIANGTEGFMVIRTNNSYDIVQPDAVYPDYLELLVDSTVKSLILVQKTTSSGSAVAYLDGGMIYSQNNGSSIRMQLVLRNCSKIHAQNAKMTVNYTDYTDPLNPVDTFKVFPFDTINENGSYILKNTDIISFAGAVKVTGVNLSVPQYPISYPASAQCQVDRGQSLLIFTDKDISVFNYTSQPVSVYYDINYALESVSIDGDGRILQNRSGDSVSYSYDFYLKDHLGSTRMVFNDDNTVTESVDYQAYGTMKSLDSSSSVLPAREKFTGKEYDIQGADFARVEYDIAVSNFYKSISGSNGSLRVTYRDVATDTRYTKRYSLRVDTISRTLLFTGSESFNSETEIERMVLSATGATDTINNNVSVDLFTVSSGMTRKVQLSATSSELITNADSSFYTMNSAIDNNTYFGGMKLFYFGSRYFDPELGVWLSVDPADYYCYSYLYASSNPAMRIDPDGRLDLLSHWIIGGWHELAGDFWRSSNPFVKRGRINHDGMEKLATEIHKFGSKKAVDDFFKSHNPSEFNMTRAQWEGFRQHAMNDAFHEYGSPNQMPYSPFEMLLYSAGKDSTGSSRILAKYQDLSGGIALGGPFATGIGGGLLSFMPITGTLFNIGSSIQQYDYVMSMATHLAQNAYYEIKNEGFGKATGQALTSDIRQTTNELAAAPLLVRFASSKPIISTILTFRSVIKHVRHWFLQD